VGWGPRRPAVAAGPRAPTPAVEATALDVDGAIELGRPAVPGGILHSIQFPTDATQPYRLSLARAGAAAGAPMTIVTVDPGSRRILEIRTPDAMTSDGVLAWLRALHQGLGLGRIWQVLVFGCGLLPALFAVTGFSMWRLKRRNRRVARARSAAEIARSTAEAD
jgi:uncharacterized iron-regulated membrane protein